jgi:hypothetical protein
MQLTRQVPARQALPLQVKFQYLQLSEWPHVGSAIRETASGRC